MQNETTPSRSWMYSLPKSPLLRYGQWLLIPALLFLGLEKMFKQWTIAREQGYVTALSTPPPRHVDAIFIGISHVWAAVDTDVFDAKASTALGRPFTSLNLGGGQRSMAMHYLGIRDLFQKYPDKFRGCTVFLEAPFDMPDKSTWNDPWYYPENEMYPIRVMHKEDLPRMLASEHSLSRKASLYGLWMENHSNLVSYRKLLRWRLLDKCETTTLKATRKAHLLQENALTETDVQSGGAMRTDSEAINIGYRTAVKWVATTLATQKPLQDWNATILADLRHLALQNGGQVVLFAMPKHSMFAPVYQTPTSQQDAKSLATTLSHWHIHILEPAFSYNDNDFPDYWHLRRTLRIPYTNALADAWLKSLNPRLSSTD